ncbi:hypothetical protein C9374_002513 [Naegleria lovaniensis]|uniref:Guanine nucleotide-binding protein subunit beta-like protein n=1 Tax=Naegleria lovaniensis TaxID=51637 RepID=A0AA88KMB0_NAELO|nr:uncharacterized protein C9374_002513 [Naegleria lovaniensis]KAG2386769.1 hypothetical protein C9374_002513 [Naegleria lovaniensis]
MSLHPNNHPSLSSSSSSILAHSHLGANNSTFRWPKTKTNSSSVQLRSSLRVNSHSSSTNCSSSVNKNGRVVSASSTSFSSKSQIHSQQDTVHVDHLPIPSSSSIPRRTPLHTRSKSLHHPPQSVNVSASSCGIGSTTEIIITSKNRQSIKNGSALTSNRLSSVVPPSQNYIQSIRNSELMYTSPCYGYRSHHDQENAHEEKENLLSPTWKDELPLVKAALLMKQQTLSTPKKDSAIENGSNQSVLLSTTPNSLKRRNTTAGVRTPSGTKIQTPIRINNNSMNTPLQQTKPQSVRKQPSFEMLETLDDECQYNAFKRITNIEAISFATATPTEVWCGEKKGVIVIFDMNSCNVIQTIREKKRLYVSCMCCCSSNPSNNNGSQQPLPLMWAGMADGTINIYSIKPKRQLLRTLVGHTGTVTSIVGLNENLIATCSVDFTIRLWDATTFSCKNSYVGLKSWVNTLCSVGSLLWSGSDDATIRVWNVLEDRTSPVNEISNQPIASSLMNQESSVNELSLDSSQMSNSVETTCSKRPMYGVTQLCYCSKTNTVWSASRDFCVKIWSTNSSIQCEKRIEFPSFVNCMHIADDNIWIATHREISVWNVTEKKLLGKYRIEGFVTCISTVGDSVWIACSDKSIRVYKLHDRHDNLEHTCQETHFTRRKRVSASRRLSSEFSTCASDLMDFEEPLEQLFEEEIDFSKTQQDFDDLKENVEEMSSCLSDPFKWSPIKGDLSCSPLFEGRFDESSIFHELYFDDHQEHLMDDIKQDDEKTKRLNRTTFSNHGNEPLKLVSEDHTHPSMIIDSKLEMNPTTVQDDSFDFLSSPEIVNNVQRDGLRHLEYHRSSLVEINLEEETLVDKQQLMDDINQCIQNTSTTSQPISLKRGNKLNRIKEMLQKILVITCWKTITVEDE